MRAAVIVGAGCLAGALWAVSGTMVDRIVGGAIVLIVGAVGIAVAWVDSS